MVIISVIRRSKVALLRRARQGAGATGACSAAFEGWDLVIIGWNGINLCISSVPSYVHVMRVGEHKIKRCPCNVCPLEENTTARLAPESTPRLRDCDESGLGGESCDCFYDVHISEVSSIFIKRDLLALLNIKML